MLHNSLKNKNGVYHSQFFSIIAKRLARNRIAPAGVLQTGPSDENICWRDVRGQSLFGELISVHPPVPFLSMQFIICGRLILGRLETFITPMHMFTETRVEAFDDRQHEARGPASALFELPCLHLTNPKSTSHNCRIPWPTMRAGGRLLALRRLSLRPAALRHPVLHLESVAEAENSVEMQPCKTTRANIAAVFLNNRDISKHIEAYLSISKI